jgi:hypothetical protein
MSSSILSFPAKESVLRRCTKANKAPNEPASGITRLMTDEKDSEEFFFQHFKRL